MCKLYAKGTEYETEDGNYWMDPVRTKVTYDPIVKVPFYKRLIGNLFYLLGKVLGKNMTITYKKQK